MEHSVRLMIIGFALLLSGVVLPFLMVIGLLTSTLPLNFFAYCCSVSGLVTGFVGIAQYRRGRK